jgi:GTP pyrophosphokinase
VNAGAVPRAGCSNLREPVARSGERVIAAAWGASEARPAALYPVDVSVAASDRPALLRDVSEVLAQEKINVIGVRSQSVRDGGGTACMTFTVEVADASRLAGALALGRLVSGVRAARRGDGDAVGAALRGRAAHLVRAPP